MDVRVMAMIRKQVYIERKQDAKLKRLASARGCTEAEVVRDAIEALPDAEPKFVQRLREMGLLVEHEGPKSTREERARVRAKFDEVLRSRGANPRLSDAILEERDESDRDL